MRHRSPFAGRESDRKGSLLQLGRERWGAAFRGSPLPLQHRYCPSRCVRQALVRQDHPEQAGGVSRRAGLPLCHLHRRQAPSRGARGQPCPCSQDARQSMRKEYYEPHQFGVSLHGTRRGSTRSQRCQERVWRLFRAQPLLLPRVRGGLGSGQEWVRCGCRALRERALPKDGAVQT